MKLKVGKVFCVVKDKNLIHPIDFTMMSDGAKRVFMILARIILANEGNVSLIAIELLSFSHSKKRVSDYYSKMPLTLR